MALCPRGVRRSICKTRPTKLQDGRTGRKLKQWEEYFILAHPTNEPYDPHKCKDGTVRTDLEVRKVTWRKRHGQAAFEHATAKKKLTPVKSFKGKGRKRKRLDMRVVLPATSRWGSRVVVSRVFAWHFLNDRGLTFSEFQRAHPDKDNDAYYWQVDHTNNNPLLTLADKLCIKEYWLNEDTTPTGPAARRARTRTRTAPPAAAQAVAATAREQQPPPPAGEGTAASTTAETARTPTDAATTAEPDAAPTAPPTEEADAAPTAPPPEAPQREEGPPGDGAVVYPSHFVRPPQGHDDVARALSEGYNPLWDPSRWELTAEREAQLRERARLKGGTAGLVAELEIRSRKDTYARLKRDAAAALTGGEAGSRSSGSAQPSNNSSAAD
jgi:hypothetical protein